MHKTQFKTPNKFKTRVNKTINTRVPLHVLSSDYFSSLAQSGAAPAAAEAPLVHAPCARLLYAAPLKKKIVWIWLKCQHEHRLLFWTNASSKMPLLDPDSLFFAIMAPTAWWKMSTQLCPEKFVLKHYLHSFSYVSRLFSKVSFLYICILCA